MNSDPDAVGDQAPRPATRLSEFATDPLWVIGPDGGFQRVNGAFVELVGHDRETLLARTMAEVLHPADADEFAHRVALLAAEGGDGVETWQGRLVSATGTGIPVELAFGITSAPAAEYAVAGRATDVREGQTREGKLNILNRALRHNIRNKMNLVIGHARTVQESDDEGFRTAGERIEAVSETVLTISDKARKAHEHTTIPPDEECRVDLVAAVEGLVTSFGISHPDATIETDLPDAARARAPPTVDVAIGELLENAVVHHESGHGTATVSIEADADTVTVRVRDRCGAIPDTVIEALERGQESPLQHSEGLGLWIVTWIVEPVGGELDFGRRPDGSGNDVTLTFERLAE
jgi:PAS domain S-box-containing protein